LQSRRELIRRKQVGWFGEDVLLQVFFVFPNMDVTYSLQNICGVYVDAESERLE
jgi:hypothetical protein